MSLETVLGKEAENKIEELITINKEKNGVDELFLRIYVAGGGCSGVQFGMALTDKKRDDDNFIDYSEKIKIVIDPMSAGYLDKSTIDYVQTGMGQRFIIKAENAYERVCSAGGCSACG